jgi:hypothetical protein
VRASAGPAEISQRDCARPAAKPPDQPRNSGPSREVRASAGPAGLRKTSGAAGRAKNQRPRKGSASKCRTSRDKPAGLRKTSSEAARRAKNFAVQFSNSGYPVTHQHQCIILVPNCELLDLLDSNDFFAMNSCQVGDFGAEIKKKTVFYRWVRYLSLYLS